MNGYYNFPPYQGVSMMGNAAPYVGSSPSIGRGLGSLFRSGSLAPGAGLSAVGGATAKTGLTFSGFLNGASKTLGVINQAIPVFYQIKPIWNNAKTMFRVMKEVNKPDTSSSSNTSINKNNNTNPNTNTDSNNISSNNGPKFFV